MRRGRVIGGKLRFRQERKSNLPPMAGLDAAYPTGGWVSVSVMTPSPSTDAEISE